MLQKEKLEAVVLASPLFLHADIAVGCMEAGMHVLSEKMMAWDVASCERIRDASLKLRRVYEVGHQRFYNGVYQAAYEGVVKAGLLGELYHARLVWHRNGNWRRKIDLPSPDYDASRWGYPDYDHLINWRLYKKYSRGHMAELASHQVAIADWFFGANASAAIGSGGVHRFKDGREVPDHSYVTLEYPGGRTVVFTSIESNAFDNYYEAYYGTKGTLIMSGEIDAFLFEEKGAGSTAPATPKATGLEVTAKAGPVGAASESRARDAAGSAVGAGTSAGRGDRNLAYKNEVSGFCAAVRTGSPLKCGADRALGSARACITGFEAIDTQKRIEIKA
jgi:predicted dehydrogenase